MTARIQMQIKKQVRKFGKHATQRGAAGNADKCCIFSDTTIQCFIHTSSE